MKCQGLELQCIFFWGYDLTCHSGQSINNMTWKVTHQIHDSGGFQTEKKGEVGGKLDWEKA